ncbi:MAG TPA: restriction endonuclease subunit S [Oscillospiraceae bacterium]|nr:restriction endonuclease subunit S [Oscillospiraceae bacterium]
MELLSVTMNDGVMPRSEIEGKDNSSEDKSNYKVVLKGDMVYNSMRMWQGANGISPCDGIVSPAYTVLMPKDPISNGYFAALFKSPNLINQFRKNSQGMTSDTWNLKYPQIAPIKVYLPTLTEQKKIADMLGTLDKRIARQTQLVDSLKKYKRGVIREFLVPEMCKLSGATWTSSKIGELGKFIKGAPLSKADISPDGTPFILYGELYTTYNELRLPIPKMGFAP